jgi:hypothetical protein
MTSALNYTVKIHQSEEKLARLKKIRESFATEIQPKIDVALRGSGIVHFARVVSIDDLYLLVITEFDGDEKVYAEFFRKALLPLFSAVFSLVENPPTEEMLNDPDQFAEMTMSLNRPSLGTDGKDHQGGEIDKGYFFQAYPGVLVKEITAKFQ